MHRYSSNTAMKLWYYISHNKITPGPFSAHGLLCSEDRVQGGGGGKSTMAHQPNPENTIYY